MCNKTLIIEGLDRKIFRVQCRGPKFCLERKIWDKHIPIRTVASAELIARRISSGLIDAKIEGDCEGCERK